MLAIPCKGQLVKIQNRQTAVYDLMIAIIVDPNEVLHCASSHLDLNSLGDAEHVECRAQDDYI